ncbi:hypothetical protein GN956_G16140 [Arapaima gigas]
MTFRQLHRAVRPNWAATPPEPRSRENLKREPSNFRLRFSKKVFGYLLHHRGARAIAFRRVIPPVCQEVLQPGEEDGREGETPVVRRTALSGRLTQTGNTANPSS